MYRLCPWWLSGWRKQVWQNVQCQFKPLLAPNEEHVSIERRAAGRVEYMISYTLHDFHFVAPRPWLSTYPTTTSTALQSPRN